jgi:hypothetical protein
MFDAGVMTVALAARVANVDPVPLWIKYLEPSARVTCVPLWLANGMAPLPLDDDILRVTACAEMTF